MSLIQLIDLPPIGDEQGSLIALESFKEVPFHIERVYYIFNTRPGVVRGLHAHKHLQQLAICVSGTCRFRLDNGQIQEDVWLNSPTQGLLLTERVWREMHDFSPDCVLLVLASAPYQEQDYIRDYKQFLTYIERFAQEESPHG